MGGKKKKNVVSRNTPAKKAKGKCLQEEIETIAVQPVLSSTTSNQLTGLQNIGNTCFFNSVLQSMNAVFEPREENLVPATKLSAGFQKCFLDMRSNTKKSYSPSMLLDAICKKCPQFKGRRQQDAHELFVCVMDKLDDENKDKSSSVSPHCDLLKDFEGKTVSIVTCSRCREKSPHHEKFCVLSLQIPGSEHLNKVPVFKTSKITKKDRRAKEVKDFTILENESHEAEAKDEGETEAEGEKMESPESIDSVDGCPISDTCPRRDGADDEVLVGQAPVSDEVEKGVEVNKEEESVGAKEQVDLPSPAPAAAPAVARLIEPPLPPPPVAGEESPLNLKRCLNAFTSLEQLLVQEGNGFHCGHCGGGADEEGLEGRRVDATKRLLLLHLPRVLVIHLKRLLPAGKQNAFVRFPPALDVASFMAIPEPEHNDGDVGSSSGVGDGDDGVLIESRAHSDQTTSEGTIDKRGGDWGDRDEGQEEESSGKLVGDFQAMAISPLKGQSPAPACGPSDEGEVEDVEKGAEVGHKTSKRGEAQATLNGEEAGTGGGDDSGSGEEESVLGIGDGDPPHIGDYSTEAQPVPAVAVTHFVPARRFPPTQYFLSAVIVHQGGAFGEWLV